jgi:polar amino acid transport system substrate-binding protein
MVKTEKASIENSRLPRTWKNALFWGVLVWMLAFGWIGCAPVGGAEPGNTPSPATMTVLLDEAPTSLARIQAKGVLVVGTAITEPFEFHHAESGELIGFDVDTAGVIADRLGVELVWVEMPFANLIPSLQDRKVDMTIAAMYINSERETMVDFAEPYLNTGLVMVAHPALQEQVQTVEDLAGLRVGVKIGATGAQLAQDLINQGIPLEMVEYKDTFDSILDLDVGRVDVVFNDYINTLVYIKDSHSDIEIVTDESGSINFLSHVGLGIAVHPGDKDLLDEINAALAAMRQDGTYDRLYETWLMSGRER